MTRQSLRPLPRPRPSLPVDFKRLSPTKSASTPRKSAPAMRSPLKERPLNNEDPKETAIKVYVRCRGRNDREINENSSIVVSTASDEIVRGKDISVQSGAGSAIYKTYSFDHVFGPESDQEMVYDGIARNSLMEMVEGYNCTIFAYGQTGTGKTHTMSGTFSSKSDKAPSEGCGVIPRTLYHLFEHLERAKRTEKPSKTAGREYSVKLSFFELYNEELRDLLSPEDEEFSRKVRIFDESGKGVTIHGMEEVYVRTAAEGLKVLEDGSFRRQVATTKYNDRSSRSHSVFTITLNMKEVSVDGEEYVRTGKLNLVDLAGSENISRSGAENKRAREAGMINQSLLTLGRVINSLVERSPHIPYRESKLTRVLQDSLGGQTKTCIIATISPAKVSLDETLSTLEYASRAKSIRNKPRVNQTTSKQALIKDYVSEIERLRGDLSASRLKNGVYMTEESLAATTEESESRRLQVEEQKLRIDVLENQVRKFKKDAAMRDAKAAELQQEHDDNCVLLDATKKELEESLRKLDVARLELSKATQALSEEVVVRQAHEKTEAAFAQFSEDLMDVSKRAISDVKSLHALVDEAVKGEQRNHRELMAAKIGIQASLESVQRGSAQLATTSQQALETIASKVGKFLGSQHDQLVQASQLLSKSYTDLDQTEVQNLQALVKNGFTEMDTFLSSLQVTRADICAKLKAGLEQVEADSLAATSETSSRLDQVTESLDTGLQNLQTSTTTIFTNLSHRMTDQVSKISQITTDFGAAMGRVEQQAQHSDRRLAALMAQEVERAAANNVLLLEQIAGCITQSHAKQVQSLKSFETDLHRELGDTVHGVREVKKTHIASIDGWLQRTVHETRGASVDKATTELSESIGVLKSAQIENLQVVKERLITDLGLKISGSVGRQVSELAENTNELSVAMTAAQGVNESQRVRLSSEIDGLRSRIEVLQHPVVESVSSLVSSTDSGSQPMRELLGQEEEEEEGQAFGVIARGVEKNAKAVSSEVDVSRGLVENGVVASSCFANKSLPSSLSLSSSSSLSSSLSSPSSSSPSLSLSPSSSSSLSSSSSSTSSSSGEKRGYEVAGFYDEAASRLKCPKRTKCRRQLILDDVKKQHEPIRGP